MRTLTHIFFCILAILWYRLIWGFSAQTASVSGGTSDGLMDGLLSRLCPSYLMADVEIRYAASEILSFFLRKGAHMFLYFVLGVLVWVALSSLPRLRRGGMTVLLCAILAGLDEYHQTLVPGRSGEVRDVLIDCSGVILALILFALPMVAPRVRQSPTLSRLLWPTTGAVMAGLLILALLSTSPFPPFVHRAEQLDGFLTLTTTEQTALLHGVAPILREALFLFLCGATGFSMVYTGRLSGGWMKSLVASITALVLMGFCSAIWNLPILPALLLSGGASFMGAVFWSLFSLRKPSCCPSSEHHNKSRNPT